MKTFLTNYYSFLSKPLINIFFLSIFAFNTQLLGQWESFSVVEETPYYVGFYDVFTLNSTVWIANSQKQVHKSIDNGQSWQTYEMGVNANRIYFIDTFRGFVIGDDGIASRTEDGGNTWTFFDTGTFSNVDLIDIHFVGETGWIIGEIGAVFKTEDGGITWTRVVLPTIPYYVLNLTDIYFYDDLEGYILGYGYGYFKTTNGGHSWNYYQYQVDGIHQVTYLKQLFFKNQLESWATNERDIYVTKDGGINWERIGYWHLRNVKRILFITEKLGWALHIDGDISRTIDGGNTWIKEREDGIGYSLDNIVFDNQGNGWAVGNNQLLKKKHQAEITISNGTIFIANQDTIPDFVDSTDFGTPLETFTRTFNIFNSYTDTLILKNNPPIIITGSSDFKIIEQSVDTILAGDSTQFVVEYTPSGNGAAAKILIENNSLTDSLFEFSVQGNCAGCIIEGSNGVCDSTENIVYTAPAGMVNYSWRLLDGNAEIIGPNDEQSVVINVRTSYTSLEVVFEEPNGCWRKCTKEIIIGLSIDEDCSYPMSGPMEVCPNTDSIRYTTRQTFIIGNGVFYGSYYALADKYKWEVINGDATIIGPDSLYEVFINAGVEDYELQLTIMNYPDCSITCSEIIDVQSVEELGICGQAVICAGTENAYFSAPDNMRTYHWKVSNQDSIFFENSTDDSFITVNQLDNDFTVNLAIETNIGCLLDDELTVKVGDDCVFQLNNIIYVNANLTSGLEDGTSWENAFINLQDALDIAEEGDQIWVAKGIYIPSKDRFGIGNPLDSASVTFYIDKEIQLFGGFSGTETTLEARDWELNQTILSGDLKRDDELVLDMLDYYFPAKNNEENANSVVYIGSGGVNTQLDGFIIQSGNADVYRNNNSANEKNTGGGLYIKGINCSTVGRVTLANCLFRYNKATSWGGGLAAVSSDRVFITPHLKSCQFRHNKGGGLAISNAISTVIEPTIEDCDFIENKGNNGGGLYLNTLAGENKAKINNCNFERNKSNRGGAIYIYLNGLKTVSNPAFYDCKISLNDVTEHNYGQGGGVYIEHELNNIPLIRPNPTSFPHFERTLFHENKAGTGGAIYTSCSYRSIYPYYLNCLFVKNTSEGDASVIYNEERNSGTIYSFFSNNTIAFNHAINGNSAFYNKGGNSIFSNSIFWENLPSDFSSERANSISIEYSLIRGNTCPQNVYCGRDNIFGQNPLFVDSTTNFNLQFESPAIDKGRNGAVFFGRSFNEDFGKNQRIIATLNPGTAIIDLGVYEFQHAPILSVAYDTQLTYQPITFALDTFYENENTIYTFAMKNVGSELLSFTESPVVQIKGDTNFHLLQQATKNELTLLEKDSFKIQFNAVEAGDFEANIQIPYNSFTGNPYELKLRMNVMPRPDTPRLKISLLEYSDIDLRDTTLRDTLCYKFGRNYLFQVENLGNGTLYYEGNEKVNLLGGSYHPKFYSIVQQPKLDSLEVGKKDTFSLLYQPNNRHSNNSVIDVSIPFNGIGDSPYEFSINTYAPWCQDSTLIAVYEAGNVEEIFDKVLIDTICWGESKDYSFKIKNIGKEYLRFKNNYPYGELNNNQYQIESNVIYNLNPADSATFEITFTADTAGTYETDVIIPYYSKNDIDYHFKLKTVILPYITSNQKEVCDAISTGEKDRTTMVMKDTTIHLGDEWCIPVYAGNVNRAYSLNTRLKWNEDYLTYKNFHSIYEGYTVNKRDNTLELYWNDPTYVGVDFLDDLPIVELCFQAIKLGHTSIDFERASVYGHGIFENNVLIRDGNFTVLEQPSYCEKEIYLYDSVNLESFRFQAENLIESNAIIDSTSVITFQAGKSITLTPGFHAKKGANFTAEIQEISCEETLSASAQQRNIIATPKQQNTDVDLTISPNPFYNSTVIQYNLAKDTEVTLQIFSLNGQLIQELVPQQWQNKGKYEYTFEPTTNVESIYFAVLITEESVLSKKLIWIK